MAPFRNRDRSNRSGRGQVEHNVLEGLPINQYKEVEVTIGPNAADKQQLDKDALWPELPMPRDSHLLPEHSQQLLRAARAGRVYKAPAPPEEDRENLDEEDEHKEVQQGFTVKKWVKIPRHLEESEPEYLAKRRKGLPSQYASVKAPVSTQPTPLRETKVKKVDAEGNVAVYKALVPEGQTVEGEVPATDVTLAETVPATAAPGTVVEGVGVVNAEGVVVVNDVAQQTPPRRRPPPPKKKSKKAGPGRGKKKVVFVEGQTDQGTPASGSELLTVPGVKQESGSVEPSDGDTPMADAGDDEEGDDDSEEEEGEDRDPSTTPGRSVTPSKAPTESATEENVVEPVVEPVTAPVSEEPVKEPTPPPVEPTIAEVEIPAPTEPLAPATEPVVLTELEVKTERKERSHDPSSSPELPLSAIAHSRQNSLNQLPTLPELEPLAPADVAASEPVPEPIPEPIPEPAPELAPESIPETVPIPEPIPDPILEPIATETVIPEVVPQPAPELIPEPVQAEIEPAPPATEPVPPAPAQEVQISESEPDLLGSLEAHLNQEQEDQPTADVADEDFRSDSSLSGENEEHEEEEE